MYTQENTSIVIEINSRPGIVPIFHENRESPFHRVPQPLLRIVKSLNGGRRLSRPRWTYALTTTTRRDSERTREEERAADRVKVLDNSRPVA